MKYQWKHVFEYAALRFLSGVLRLLPTRLSFFMVRLLAWLTAATICRKKITEARERIATTFETTTDTSFVRNVAWISWRNTCFTALELLLSNEKRVKALTESADYSELRKLTSNLAAESASKGKGFIIATMHMGNWEQGGTVAKQVGLPIKTLARRQKNPLIDRFIEKKRKAAGIDVVTTDNASPKSIIRDLRESISLGILPDVRPRDPRLIVDFLGSKAGCAAGMAMFARQANTTIYPIVFRRVGWREHTCKILSPVMPEPGLTKKEDWQRMTQAVMTLFDREIRETPEQYFWFNKRWILLPKNKLDALTNQLNSEVAPTSQTETEEITS